MVLARTSKLQAVNKALQMMGESPLNSLQGLLGLGNLAEELLEKETLVSEEIIDILGPRPQATGI